MLFCGNCGAGKSDDAVFCASCGASTARVPDSGQALIPEGVVGETKIDLAKTQVDKARDLFPKPWYRKAVITIPLFVASMFVAVLTMMYLTTSQRSYDYLKSVKVGNLPHSVPSGIADTTLECSGSLDRASLLARMPSVLKEVIGVNAPAIFTVKFSPVSKCWAIVTARPKDQSTTPPLNQWWQGFTAYLNAKNDHWVIVTYGTSLGSQCSKKTYPKPGSPYYIPKTVLCR